MNNTEQQRYRVMELISRFVVMEKKQTRHWVNNGLASSGWHVVLAWSCVQDCFSQLVGVSDFPKNKLVTS